MLYIHKNSKREKKNNAPKHNVPELLVFLTHLKREKTNVDKKHFFVRKGKRAGGGGGGHIKNEQASAG